jgi:hypothetical protein
MARKPPERDAESRRYMGASRSRWTEQDGWTTPPEDLTPLSPAPRSSGDWRMPVVVAVLVLVLAWLAVVAWELR